MAISFETTYSLPTAILSHCGQVAKLLVKFLNLNFYNFDYLNNIKNRFHSLFSSRRDLSKTVEFLFLRQKFAKKVNFSNYFPFWDIWVQIFCHFWCHPCPKRPENGQICPLVKFFPQIHSELHILFIKRLKPWFDGFFLV